MGTDPAFALSLAIIVAVVYLVVLRLVDINEKEPLWALVVALLLGAVAAALLHVLAGPRVHTLDRVGEALSSEVAKFCAVAGLVALLGSVSRLRGWSEIHGVVDGVVYGAAVGLGFAVGEVFVREAMVTATAAAGDPGALALLWTTALDGLAEGLFGAIVGAGWGYALTAPRRPPAAVAVALALVLAAATHLGYAAFADGNAADGGSQAVLRQWIALLLPLLAVTAALAHGLRRERSAIARELSDDAAHGRVSAEELALLQRPWERRLLYARHFLRGDLDGWLDVRTRHNRLVQLALVEHQARDASGERQLRLAREADRLRADLAGPGSWPHPTSEAHS